MLNETQLPELLSDENLDVADKILICLALNVDSPKQVREIREISYRHGYPKLKNPKVNISSILGRKKSFVVKLPSGYQLTSKGQERVSEILAEQISLPVILIRHSLRDCLQKIKDDKVKAFVKEAVTCFESRLYRAAVVLSWVGAVAVLQKHVMDNHLDSFNKEAPKHVHSNKWKPITTESEISSRLKERQFLDILANISVIDKNTKNALVECLDRRNTCGHPNDFKLQENVVAAHLEVLILNVFSVFSA